MDPKTGKTIWKIERPGFRGNWSTPMVSRINGVDQLVVYGIWWMKAYDLNDGSEIWSFPGLTDEPIITPVSGDGLLFFTSYNMKTNPEVIGLPTWDSLLLMYDADRNGRVTQKEWGKIMAWVDGFPQENALIALKPAVASGQDPSVAWRYSYGVPECPSPLYYKGLVWMVADGGLVTCVDAGSGKLVYSSKLGSGGAYYASPVCGDGKIYAASARGVITIFAAGTEFTVLSVNDLKERIMATPAIAGGRIYVRTAGGLCSFGK